MAVVYVLLILVCNKFPPEAASYHLKIGVAKPDVEVTLAVGTPTPHCVELVAVGAVGTGLTVTVALPVLIAAQP